MLEKIISTFLCDTKTEAHLWQKSAKGSVGKSTRACFQSFLPGSTNLQTEERSQRMFLQLNFLGYI